MRVLGSLRRHWKGSLAGAVALLAVLVVGAPYFYIHVIEGPPPAPLALASPAATDVTGNATIADDDSVAGTYKVGSGSIAGYRVSETLAGQHATAVGRTSEVTGSVTIRGRRVTAATFVVQMASVTSDQSQRDDQFRGRIMNVAQFPTGSFTLTKPIVLDAVPTVGATVKASARGDLTLHGTTNPVTLSLQAERTATGIVVTGTTAIAYGDYGISNPSFGGFVSVGDSGAFEVLLNLTKA